jgi:hypothetical protein
VKKGRSEGGRWKGSIVTSSKEDGVSGVQIIDSLPVLQEKQWRHTGASIGDLHANRCLVTAPLHEARPGPPIQALFFLQDDFM